MLPCSGLRSVALENLDELGQCGDLLARGVDDGAALLQRRPEYADTNALDELRATEYARLDATGQIYLDFTGAGLYAESQVREHMALLAGRVFGNPHSASISSSATTTLVENTRRSVLDYFGADPEEYTAVFTLNATGALKLIGEAYPFEPASRFLLTADNHNSVNGIRELPVRW